MMKKILIIQDIDDKGKEILSNHPDYEFEVIDDVNDPELKKKLKHINEKSFNN